GAMTIMFMTRPTSFLPEEDQGYILVQVQGPPGSTQGHTGQALADVSDYLLHQESKMVDAGFTINGSNYAGRGQNQGQLFVHLRDWSERTTSDLKAAALIK